MPIKQFNRLPLCPVFGWNKRQNTNLGLQLVLLICFLALTQSGLGSEPATIGISAGQAAVEPGPVGCMGVFGTNDGTFIISLNFTALNPVTVFLSRAGTAVGPPFPVTGCATPVSADYAVDYAVSGGCNGGVPESVVIPAGTNSITVHIIPNFNNDTTPEKTVIMSIVSYFPTNYILTASTATNYVQHVDTYGAGLDNMPQSVMEGESTTLTLQRTPGCDIGSSLFGTPDSIVFYLTGDASYGSDYIVNPTSDVSVDASSRPVVVYCTIDFSNSVAYIPITTYATCAYGDKTIGFVPSCNYNSGGGCYYGPTRLATNSDGCVYLDGIYDYVTITHPTNQPTLDTVIYSDSIFQFNINGQTGAPYSILVSTNLFDWVNVASFTMASCTVQASDILAGDFPERFYRVILGNGGPTNSEEFTFGEAAESMQYSHAMSRVPITATENNISQSTQEDPLTPNEEYMLIEAQRLKWEDESNPAAAILPPTPLTPAASPLRATEQKK